ncbi:MAG: TolC family protein [Bacteroidales bacterium]|nr:TolC family protein [Bacteroidales bacterium]
MKKTIYILIVFYVHISWQTMAQIESTNVALSQCIDAALINNPSIKESENDASISALGIKMAQSGLYPTVSIEGSGGISDQYRLGNDYKIGTAKLTIDQLIWQKGKVKSVIEQTRFTKDASIASLEARKQELIVSVKKIYFTCLQQNQLYLVAQDNVSKAELFLEYARERYKIGVGRKSDILKAESDLAEAEFERDSYRNSLKQSQNELSMLTGLSDNNQSLLVDTWQVGNLETYNKQSDSLFAIAFKNYPELQMINNLGLMQQAKIQETKAEFYPRIGVSAGYNWSYNPIVQKQNSWYSVVALRWNIFNGNEKRYRLQSEKIRRISYENQADEIKTFLIKEVSNCLISIKEAENQIVLTNKLMKTTSENLEIAKSQFNVGTGSMLELTDARVKDLSAKQKNIQAMTTFQIAMANLERLIGNTNETPML